MGRASGHLVFKGDRASVGSGKVGEMGDGESHTTM